MCHVSMCILYLDLYMLHVCILYVRMYNIMYSVILYQCLIFYQVTYVS